MLSKLLLFGSLISPLSVAASSSAPPSSFAPPSYTPPSYTPPSYVPPPKPSPSGGNSQSTYPPYGSNNNATYRICPNRKPGHQGCIYPRNVLRGYEYIVIGSGIGGGPVAANLARKGHSVLLIEAGTDQHEKNLNVTVPLFNFASSEDPKVSWSFFVTHYDNPKRAERDPKLVYDTPNGTQHTGPGAPPGSKIKGIFYPRGATIGGSGAHNALVNIYPHATDWDNIANITNDNSFNADKMRRYWESIEHAEYVGPGAEGHGYKGWLHTNRMAYNVFKDSKFTNQMMAAAEVAGNPVRTLKQLLGLLRRDVNAPSRIRDEEKGLYSFPLFMKGSRRSSVANFVMDTFHARNEDGTQKYPLHIRTNCLATRLIFDQTKSPPKAIGVEFLDGESLYRADPRAGAANIGTPGVAYTNKEVILSGGAYNSPQILKLSGIGPAEELKKFNIPVIVNSPGVGKNLQDRYECSVVSKTDAHFTPYESCTGGRPGDPCLQEWRTNPTNTSIYATMGVVGGIFDRSKYATSIDDDLFVFGGAYINRGYFPGYSVVANKDTKHWTWMFLKAHTGNHAGHVNLRSADPRAVPDINFNYFDFGTPDAANADAGAVAEAVKISRQIMDTYAERYPYANQYTEVLPGRHVKTDAQIKQYVQDYSWGHHCSCTNPMGPDSDPMAVVNSKFQVRGVTGLRIVDASVFPKIPGVFIAAPTYILSAKASEVIAQDAETSCSV